jgi:hypothetical protein
MERHFFWGFHVNTDTKVYEKKLVPLYVISHIQMQAKYISILCQEIQNTRITFYIYGYEITLNVVCIFVFGMF